MTQLPTTVRPTSSRRPGYVVGALVNAALLWLVHVWPGWEAMPFLTADMQQVLGLVDASLVAGVVVNAAHLVRDPDWLTPAGNLVTTTFGLAAAVRILRVFPFDLDPGWAAVARVVLVVAVVGSAIALLVALVGLLRVLRPSPDGKPTGRSR